MSTKENPGPFDCYDRLLPGEEYFLLRAKDPDFELFVKQWAFNRRMQINMGSRPDTQKENDRIKSALNCAQDGKSWRESYNTKLEVAAIEANGGFDQDGVPITGEHARRATTTSGMDIPQKD